MSLMTNPLVLRMRSALRAAGLTKLLARLSTRSDYETNFSNALRGNIEMGDIIWDVGANVGYYTLKFSGWVGPQGRVYAFEPSPQNLSRLKTTCDGQQNIVVCPVGLSRNTCRVPFEEGADDLGSTSRVVARDQSSKSTYNEVTLRAGDGLISDGEIEIPNIIKIDVEGHEHDVLEGLKNTLTEPNLRSVFMEIHFSILEQNGQGDAPLKIECLLRENGFKLSWTDPSHLHAFR